MLKTAIVIFLIALAPMAAAAPTASMTADEAYVKSVTLTQANYAKLSGDNAELRAMLSMALGKLKDLETRANAQDTTAKTALVAFATGNTAGGVSQLTAQAKIKAQSSVAQAKAAVTEFKAAGALALGTDPVQAVGAYQEALAISPNDADTLHDLSWLYAERLGQYDNAIAMADRMIALASEDAKRRGYLDRGQAQWRKGDLTGAELSLQASLDLATKAGLKSDQASALTNLANVAADRGDYARAEAMDKRTLALAVETGDKQMQVIMLNNLGDDALARHDLAGAESYLNRAIAETDDLQLKAASQELLARVAAVRGDTSLACSLSKQSLSTLKSIGATGTHDVELAQGNIAKYCPKP